MEPIGSFRGSFTCSNGMFTQEAYEVFDREALVDTPMETNEDFPYGLVLLELPADADENVQAVKAAEQILRTMRPVMRCIMHWIELLEFFIQKMRITTLMP